MKKLLVNGMWAFLAVATLAGCATNPVTGGKDFVLMSEGQEIDLGRQYHKEVMKQYKVYDDPELAALVDKLGQELAEKSHRSGLDFQFILLDSPEVNAFALPGGFVYITRGIIAYMNSEEELAGVLGHEIGHVTARHSVRQHAATTTAGLLGAVATIITGSQGVAQLSNQLGGALVSGYGRSHELEADRLGAEYLARTGYDPQMMLEVVGILKDQEEFEIQRAREERRQPKIYHGVFSTHPDNDRRLQEVIEAAEKFRNPEAKRSDPEAFLKVLDNVTFGNSEDQGIVHGNRFYHKDLDFRIEFPSGWRVENQPDQLLAIQPGEKAMFMVRLDQQQGRESPEAFLHRKFDKLRRGQSLATNGYTGLVEGNSPFGTGTIRVAAVAQNGNMFILYGAASGRIPDNEFFGTVRSIRHLDEQERALATARHIKLIRAGPGETFAALAVQSDLDKNAESQLRLLNGMYPDGEPRKGQLVKVVQ